MNVYDIESQAATSRPFAARVRLRQATSGPHAALDRGLALLDPAPDPARFVLLLQLFAGFHTVWDSAMAAALGALFEERRRMPNLVHDLAAFGFDEEKCLQLPRCEQAAGLGADTATALGSLYVLEGSRLGGRLIARHLAEHAAWLPAQGLRYFADEETGASWRRLGLVLDDAAQAGGMAAMERGALLTFAMLQDWLTPAFRQEGRSMQ